MNVSFDKSQPPPESKNIISDDLVVENILRNMAETNFNNEPLSTSNNPLEIPNLQTENLHKEPFIIKNYSANPRLRRPEFHLLPRHPKEHKTRVITPSRHSLWYASTTSLNSKLRFLSRGASGISCSTSSFSLSGLVWARGGSMLGEGGSPAPLDSMSG